MESFSQRMGLTPIRTVLQIESIDKALRNGLWNAIYKHFFKTYFITIGRLDRKDSQIYKFIWTDFYYEVLDEMPSQVLITIGIIKDRFFKSKWYEVYDLVQFLAKLKSPEYAIQIESFIKECNFLLERELSGYRFISNQLSPISSDIEMMSIEDILNNDDILHSVKSQIKRSLELFSDREKPDYRNSIKESISAVEGYCKIITGDAKATLAKALQKIEKTHPIHPSLKLAFDKLYAYTSDEGGIRHAMLDDGKEIAQEDALFMLIACSAFINYLKQKAAKS